MLKTVWRIETKEGIGLYRADLDWRIQDAIGFNLHDINELHPGPKQDPGLSLDWSCLSSIEKESFQFGFASKTQLKLWVYAKEARNWLGDRGMLATRYTIADRHHMRGMFQAVFVKSNADKHESINLRDF